MAWRHCPCCGHVWAPDAPPDECPECGADLEPRRAA